MDALDEPFSAVDKVLEDTPLGMAADAIIIEMHAEATSEKMAMGHFCDGRASLVVGAHTHIPHRRRADPAPAALPIRPTRGACCDYDSVIGMGKEESVRRFTTKLPGERHKPAEGPAHRLRRVRRDRSEDGVGDAGRPDPHRRPADRPCAGALGVVFIAQDQPPDHQFVDLQPPEPSAADDEPTYR